MKRAFITSAITAVACLLVSTMSYAQGMAVKRMDTDGNGILSFAEFSADWDKRGEKRFEKMDVDADGVIDADELQAERDRREFAKQERQKKLCK